MKSQAVSYHLDGDIGVIQVDNPPVNALSRAVRAGIIDALQQSSADASKLTILKCEGRTFIAGADITEFDKPPMAPSLPEVIQALESHSKPVLCAMHGNALGGGLEVAMATHYRCALESTKLGLPEVKLGLLPGSGGTQRLPRLVGVSEALAMMISGNPISAQKSLELGLVDRLVEGDLENAASKYAAELIAEEAGPRPTAALSVEPKPDKFFAEYHASIAGKTRSLISPGYIVDLVEAATQLPLDEGQALERSRFIECRNSPQSAALRHAFFAERTASKVANIPAETTVRLVGSVAVIGAGTMGGGIAMNFIQAGIPVTLLENSPEALRRGLDLIQNNYAKSVKRKRFSADQVARFMALITGSTDYGDLTEVEAVIEAVFEDLEVKKEVFKTLDAICKPECILATNTSYLNIDEIAAVTKRPDQVIGAHFFSPANVMKLLEVVRGKHTAPDVIATFMQLSKRIGKIPVLVRVCHGFVGNRMLRVYARQAQLLLLEGASPVQVDSSVIQDWGMAMGPLAVGDLAGLDIGYRSRRGLGIDSKSQLESALPDTLVEMDRLGQKSGSGYYLYDADSRQGKSNPAVDALIADIAGQWKITRRTLSNDEIVDRLMLVLINEGAAILEEGIAARPSDIDTVYLNGYGFPRRRGGPMFYADHLGLDVVLEKLRALQVSSGDPCWHPAPLLVDLQSQGRSLASLN